MPTTQRMQYVQCCSVQVRYWCSGVRRTQDAASCEAPRCVCVIYIPWAPGRCMGNSARKQGHCYGPFRLAQVVSDMAAATELWCGMRPPQPVHQHTIQTNIVGNIVTCSTTSDRTAPADSQCGHTHAQQCWRWSQPIRAPQARPSLSGLRHLDPRASNSVELPPPSSQMHVSSQHNRPH